MEYLHSIEPHPVIHGDLKIQNVLVGDELVAKVCIANTQQLPATNVLDREIYPPGADSRGMRGMWPHPLLTGCVFVTFSFCPII